VTNEQIARLVDSIELDLANVASADGCEHWRGHVYPSRGLQPPQYREPWDIPPATSSSCPRF
jgi:hypothetical protein